MGQTTGPQSFRMRTFKVKRHCRGWEKIIFLDLESPNLMA